MSFPRYPKYKDSGVEWLGQVPEHWYVKRIGYYFEERREKVSDKDFPALSVTKNGIVPQLDTAAKSDDGDNRKKVLKGDFVINSRSDRKGSSGASELDGSVSLICTVMSPLEQVHTPYVHHLLRSQPFQEEFYRNGKGIVADLWSTNYSEMRNILLGMPPLVEQTRIAEFLDRETAKIDELVHEQERLMALLKEKRQSVISHAVTKGLNPNAPMKPSGIEWLGDVPAHWRTTRLKYAAKMIVDCPHETPTYSDEGDFLVVRTADLEHGQLDETAMYRVDQSEYENRIRRAALFINDIVYSREGERWGHAALVPTNDKFCLGQRMMQFRAEETFCPSFLMWQLNSKTTYTQGDVDTVGATSPHVNVGTIRNYDLSEPPIKEQREISLFLDEQTQSFDTLTAEAQRAIDLLQERRTALISAAVTGQIDVRNT